MAQKFFSQVDISTPSSTPPLVVSSDALVSKLNADELDGAHAANFRQEAGVFFDGATSNSDVRNLSVPASIGASDITMWVRFKVPSTVGSVNRGLMFLSDSTGYASANGTTIAVFISSGGTLDFRLTKDSTNYGARIIRLSGFITAYAGQVVDVVCVRSVSGNSGTLYLNGVSVGTETTSGSPLPSWNDTLASGALVVGRLESTSVFNSTIYRAAVFNRALSASDAADLVINGIHPADQWGTQTNPINTTTSNGGFETAGSGGADAVASWTEYTTGTTTITRDTTVYSPNLSSTASIKFLIDGSNSAANVSVAAGVAPNKRYRLTFDWRHNSANSNVSAQYTIGAGASDLGTTTAPANVWTTFTTEGISNGFLLGLSRSYTAGPGASVWYDNVILERIGAVVDLDLGIGRGTTIPDRSSNLLNGAINGTVSHLVPTRFGTDLVTNLNADLLDGQHGSYYLDTSSTAQTKTGNLTISNTLTANVAIVSPQHAWANASGYEASNSEYAGPRTMFELAYALGQAHGVNDTFRYRSVITREQFDGTSWSTDSTTAWANLLVPDIGGTTIITSQNYTNGITKKRCVIDLGGDWRRPNLIFIRRAFNGANFSFSVEVEKSIDNTTWTSLGVQSVPNGPGLAYFSQTDATQSRYWRITITATQDVSAGGLTIDRIMAFGPRVGTIHPFTVDVSRNVSFAANVSIAGTLGVTGATTLSSTLAVSSTLSVTGAQTFVGSATWRNGTSDMQISLGPLTTGNTNNAAAFNMYSGGGKYWHQVVRGDSHATQPNKWILGFYDALAAFTTAISANETGEVGIAGLPVSGTKLTVSGAANITGAITQNGSQVLHAGNFNTYAPTLTGTGASGTWGINIAGSSNSVSVIDTRATATTPETTSYAYTRFDFKQNTTEGLSDGGTYFGEFTFRPYGTTTDWTGGPAHQLGFTHNGNLYMRSGTYTTWGSWKKLWSDANDGASSGLDADLLDGQQGSYYLDTSATAQTKSGNLTISGTTQLSGNVWVGGSGNAWTIASVQMSAGSIFGSATTAGLTYNAYFDSAWKRVGANTAIQYLQSSSGNYWYYATSAAAGTTIGWTTAMALEDSNLRVYNNITADGNLSISGSQTFLSDATWRNVAGSKAINIGPLDTGNTGTAGAVNLYSGGGRYWQQGVRGDTHATQAYWWNLSFYDGFTTNQAISINSSCLMGIGGNPTAGYRLSVYGALIVTGATQVNSTLSATGAISENGNQVLHAGNFTSYCDPRYTRKYSVTIGDGYATQFDITHNLGTTDVTVSVKRMSDNVIANYTTTISTYSTNVVRVNFATAPTSGQYRVTVIG